MAHTPLFAALRKHLRLARLAAKPNAPPVDELLAQHRAYTWSRRKFLQEMGLGALSVFGVSSWTGCRSVQPTRFRRGAPRVAIVGAGVAGLNAAYQLKRSGIRATVYEASARTGGRMFTSTSLMGPGIATELGGEFIDSHHKDVLSLAREFRLPLLDMNDPRESALNPEAYFFNGRHLGEAEIIDGFRPLAARLQSDVEKLGDEISFERNGGAAEWDQMSIVDYLDRRGATGVLRKLIEVAYVTEYGLECDEQSALNLLLLIGTDPADESFEAFGDSDERFKIKGGNQRITDELAQRLPDQIELGCRLVVVKSSAAGLNLTFESPDHSAMLPVTADFVILTVPFTVLRDVELKLDLPDVKRRAIAELGYGTNAKLFVGQSRRPWCEQGFAGDIFSDEGFQLAWDHSRLQGTRDAGLTLFSGGRAGVAVGEGSPRDQIDQLLPGVDRAFPGVLAARQGVAQRFHWPTHPFTRGSYSCYRPGQWTTLAGAEALPVGQLLFAGEHCSRESQGYMNGGAETGRQAAQRILAIMTA